MAHAADSVKVGFVSTLSGPAAALALRAKRFQSVRGDFRWDNNNHPIQDWYVRIIGRDAAGRITNKTVGVVQKDLGDPHAAKCPLKW